MTAKIQDDPPATNGQAPPRKPVRSHRWVWFFVIVAVLTAAAIAILWVYNVQQQLTPEELADELGAARGRWKAHGPHDYDLTYKLEGNVSQTYVVRVRGGEVRYAEPDSRPLQEKAYYYGMPALFRYVEGFLKIDLNRDNPRPYLVATFDPDDGHLVHFVRRVSGTAERLEITVDFKKVSPK